MTDEDPWDSVTDEEPQPLEGGEHALGRYVLCRELAAGGMGTVYLARAADRAGLDRPIAIKVIHRHLARRSDLVEMFQDEARIHARIQHPNVCSVFDFGQTEGTFFLAMEYLLGESLATLLREVGRRPAIAESARWPALAARMIVDACEGLHAAHELKDDDGRALGVVHRDVSPQNLFVTYDGNTKVLDFGVALARGRVHATIAGGLKGKLSYMAPEQARAESLDRRADVWALGVCLWEALTTRRLFKRASEMGILGALARDEIEPPSRRTRAPIPPELDAIVTRALQRDPNERTPSARALGRELSAWLHTQSEPIGPSEIAELLGELFAPRRGVKREVVQTMLSGPPIATMSSASVLLDAASRAGDPTRTPTLLPRDRAGLPHAMGAVVASNASTTGDASEPPESRARWAVGAGIVVVGALGIGIGWMAGSGEEPPTTLAPIPTALTAPPPSTTTPIPTSLDVPSFEEEHRLDGPTVDDPVEDDEDPSQVTPRRRRTPIVTSTPPETTTAAPPQEGRVNVVTPGGWADIVVSGRVLGRTPRQITLPVGTRTIELRPFGRTPGDHVEVVVEPGETARVVRPVAR